MEVAERAGRGDVPLRFANFSPPRAHFSGAGTSLDQRKFRGSDSNFIYHACSKSLARRSRLHHLMRPVPLAALLVSACILITCHGQLPSGGSKANPGHDRNSRGNHGHGFGQKMARFLRLPWARKHVVTHDGRPAGECETISCLLESNQALAREIASLKSSSKSVELQFLLDSEMSTSQGLARSLEELRASIAGLETSLKGETSVKNAAERERDALEILHREVSTKLSAAESRSARLAEDASTQGIAHAKEIASLIEAHRLEVAKTDAAAAGKDKEIKKIKEALGASASSAHALDVKIGEVERANKELEASLTRAAKKTFALEAEHAMAMSQAASDTKAATDLLRANAGEANKELSAAKMELSASQAREAKLQGDLNAQDALKEEAEAALALATASLAEGTVRLEALAAAEGSGTSAASLLAASAFALAAAAFFAHLAPPKVIKVSTSEGHTQTAPPKEVKLVSHETQCDLVATMCSGVQAVAECAGAAVQASVSSSTSGMMTEPKEVVSVEESYFRHKAVRAELQCAVLTPPLAHLRPASRR